MRRPSYKDGQQDFRIALVKRKMHNISKPQSSRESRVTETSSPFLLNKDHLCIIDMLCLCEHQANEQISAIKVLAYSRRYMGEEIMANVGECGR